MKTLKLKTNVHGVKKTKTKKRTLSSKHHNRIISRFLHTLNCVKMYHWSTSSYSQHKATDDLYSELNKHIDDFVETMLGKVKSRVHSINISSCRALNKQQFLKIIRSFKTFLIDLNHVLDTKYDSNLYNIRDEMLQVLDKLIYLFELK